MTFSTLADVRSQIDSIDSELVSLIAQRAECVKAAAAFKTDHPPFVLRARAAGY